MLRRRTARPGFSLMEVVVALFVMALGVICLFTLFPLGAVQMGRALRDDRAQTTVLQADGVVRLLWENQIAEVLNPTDQFYTSLSNPGGTLTAIPATAVPSYPVLFDPIGHQARGGSLVVATPGNWLANTVSGFPRRTSNSGNYNLANNYLASFRACTLMDDLEFARDPAFNTGTTPPGSAAGGPETGAGAVDTVLVRGGRYNWAAVVQRPNNNNPKVVDLKVLVFDRRAPGIAPATAELRYNVTFTVGSTQVVIPDTLDNLGLRTGGWLMDGTITDGAVPNPGIRNANFYRIQTLTEVGATTVVELQTPIRPTTGTSYAAYNGHLYVLSNLIEVFDRPQLVPTNYTLQTP